MTTRFVCLFLLIIINFLCFKHVGVVNIQIMFNLKSNFVCLARISGRGNNASTLILECLLQAIIWNTWKDETVALFTNATQI